MDNRFTRIDEKILNKFHTCKFEEWFPKINISSESLYEEYNFFKQKLETIENITLLRENDIIYIRVSEYEYNNIKFNMSVDLDYDIMDFLVEDGTKVDDIRELVENIINNAEQ